MDASRLPPSALKSSAQESDQDPQKEEEIFEISARCLRNERGVPSVTASGVKKALTLLELDPHRLVRQGLAPKRLLKRSVAAVPDKVDGADGAKGAGQPSQDKDEIDGTVAVAAEDAAGSVEGTVQDGIYGAKERDGVISADQNVETTRLGEKSEKASPTEEVEKTLPVEGVEGTSSREVPDSEPCGAAGGAKSEVKSKAEEAGNDAVPAEASADGNEGKTLNISRPAVDPIHDVLVARGVTISPEEVEPFLNALGVRPRRFVSLGLVDRKALSEAARGATRDKQRHYPFFGIGGLVRDVGHFITDAVGAPRRVVHLGLANRGALREVNGRENTTKRHHPFFGIGAFVRSVGHVIADAVGARVALHRRNAGPPHNSSPVPPSPCGSPTVPPAPGRKSIDL